MRKIPLVVLGLALGACGGATSQDSGELLSDAGAASDGALASDAALECTFGSGANGTWYASEFELIVRHGAADELALYANLGSSLGCFALDSVALVEGEDVRGSLTPTYDGICQGWCELARGPIVAYVNDLCAASSANRFDAVTLQIDGRATDGSFSERVGAIPNGSHWPPLLRVTCQDGIALAPGSASLALVGPKMAPSTSFEFYFPNVEDGLEFTSLNGKINVIAMATQDAVPLYMPTFTIDGWTLTPYVSTVDSRRIGAMSLQSGALLEQTICPTLTNADDAAAIIIGISGVSTNGPFSAEVYVGPACFDQTH